MKKNLFSTALLLGASILTFGQSNTFPPSGNVGIGVTDPKTKLEIYNEPSLGNLLLSTYDNINADKSRIDIDFHIRGRNHTIAKISSNYDSSNSGGSGGLYFSTLNKGKLNKNLIITSIGYIGIGIKPETKLEVDGDISARGYSSIGFNTYDAFDYKNQKVAHYGLTRIGNFVGLSGWDGLRFLSGGNQKMIINSLGRVGIGTDIPDEKLTVKGKIHAEEVIVDLNVPADYVFQKYYTGKSDLKADYVFPKLNEIESFVKENNHLPDMPSAKEIQENGLKIGEMNNLLLQKIEELTLLLIEQNKKIIEQDKTNLKQEEQLINLKEEINQLKQK